MVKHRLSRSSSAEPTELLAAIRKSLPSQLPPLDSHTIAKLKVITIQCQFTRMWGLQAAWAPLPPPVRPATAACRRRHACLLRPHAAAADHMHPLQEQALRKAADLQQQASHSAKQGLHGARLVSSAASQPPGEPVIQTCDHVRLWMRLILHLVMRCRWPRM